ncbi:MAG: prolipoprotein diacylglyceryl transferase [Phycisphaerales bacterium]|nr:MAG: prolipoprotein diacylglyceryl transferase [Phycisphaerales bacterium]
MTPWLAQWLHDLDPVALRLGPITVYWYGISYLVGFALAWALLVVAARRGLTPIPASAVGDLVLFGGIGGVVGGRVGYVLIYGPHLLTEVTQSFPYWQALNLARGGMASHGGFVGALVGLAWAARSLRRRARAEGIQPLADLPTLHVVDLAAAVAPIGLMCGRIANFVNGELLGKIVARPGEPAPWWSVRFPQEILDRYWTPEITEANLRGAAEAVGMSHLELPTEAGRQRFFEAYLQLVESLRHGSQEAANAMGHFLNARHPSQLYQAAVEGPLLLLALAIVWARPRVAGVVTGWFMILYGLGRIATETVRLPDAGFAVARPLGLSRGQWLSAALVAAGVGLLAWVLLRARARQAKGDAPPRFGGWLAPAFAGPAPAQPRDAQGQSGPNDDQRR